MKSFRELSSTFARLCHLVDENLTDMQNDIKQLETELRNKANYLAGELDRFDQSYLSADLWATTWRTWTMLLSMSQESWNRNGTVSQYLLGIELSSRQLMFCCWQTRHLLSAISIGRFIYISLFTLPSSMKCGNGTTEQPFCLFPLFSLLKPTIKMRTIKPTLFSSVSLKRQKTQLCSVPSPDQLCNTR